MPTSRIMLSKFGATAHFLARDGGHVMYPIGHDSSEVWRRGGGPARPRQWYREGDRFDDFDRSNFDFLISLDSHRWWEMESEWVAMFWLLTGEQGVVGRGAGERPGR